MIDFLAMWQRIVQWPEKKWLIVILLAVGFVTQFMWLSYPREVIFDEVHFGKFVTAYCCTGERFFDIHPPHAKLLIAGVAYLSGYEGGLSFSNISQPYGDVSPIGLRLVPAIAGTLLPLLVFVLLRQLGASWAASFFGGMLIAFDNAFTVQNRLISLDGVLLVSIIGSLSAYLKVDKLVELKKVWTWQWAMFCVLAGGLAGLAVGSKFTGLVAGGLIGVIICLRLLQSIRWDDLWRWLATALLIVVSGLVIYGAGWALHFTLLPLPGSGDAWGIPQWDKPIIGSFIRETIDLHKTMYHANYDLTATHPDASKWWSWSWMQTSVFYWQYSGVATNGDERVGTIYFLGNPIVWWGGGIVFMLALLHTGLNRIKGIPVSSIIGKKGWILIVGYIIAFVPLMRVPRALFLYHYLTPLLFSIIIGVLWLDKLHWFKEGSVWQQPKRFFVGLGMLVLFFLVMSPLTYGFLLSPEMQEMIFWLETWR
jgi:dolichyl-phosphate-mannose-protein mannosyltransferase